MIDFNLIWDSIPSLLYGTCVSLEITFLAVFMGMSIGSIFGVAEASKSRFISLGIGMYVAIFPTSTLFSVSN